MVLNFHTDFYAMKNNRFHQSFEVTAKITYKYYMFLYILLKLWNGPFYKLRILLSFCVVYLTHWGQATHICVSKLTIIASDNDLLPGRRQAIIWTSAGILLIGPLWTNFSEILIEIPTFSFKKVHLKVSSAKGRPFCLGLNVLTHLPLVPHICLHQQWAR